MYLDQVRCANCRDAANLLDAFKIKLFFHARIIGIVNIGLVKPLDEVYQLLALLLLGIADFRSGLTHGTTESEVISQSC